MSSSRNTSSRQEESDNNQESDNEEQDENREVRPRKRRNTGRRVNEQNNRTQRPRRACTANVNYNTDPYRNFIRNGDGDENLQAWEIENSSFEDNKLLRENNSLAEYESFKDIGKGTFLSLHVPEKTIVKINGLPNLPIAEIIAIIIASIVIKLSETDTNVFDKSKAEISKYRLLSSFPLAHSTKINPSEIKARIESDNFQAHIGCVERMNVITFPEDFYILNYKSLTKLLDLMRGEIDIEHDRLNVLHFYNFEDMTKENFKQKIVEIISQSEFLRSKGINLNRLNIVDKPRYNLKDEKSVVRHVNLESLTMLYDLN